MERRSVKGCLEKNSVLEEVLHEVFTFWACRNAYGRLCTFILRLRGLFTFYFNYLFEL